MLVDVHTHLDDRSFEKNLNEVIERAEKNNVVKIINCGLNPESNRRTLEISRKYKIVEPALGIYPGYVLGLTDEEIDGEIDFIRNKKIKAISEVGLDGTYEKISKQKRVFEKFISLAEKKNLPLIVHSRKAEQEIIDSLESSNVKKVVMHCFTGNKKQIKQIEDNNWFFSIPPIIVRSKHFQFIVGEVSISNLLTESDAPYLSPYKNKKNEPSFITETIKIISKIKNLEKSEVEKIIFMNYKKFF